jgi:hypothetical protein
MMRDIGINKVYYSTGTNEGMVCELVKDMVSIQASAATKNCYNKFKNDYLSDEVSSKMYFENLIKKLFPKEIKYINLKLFIEYNFKNVLPKYSFIIEDNIIIFINDKNQKILLANLI